MLDISILSAGSGREGHPLTPAGVKRSFPCMSCAAAVLTKLGEGLDFSQLKNRQVQLKGSCHVGCPFPRLLARENRLSLGLFLVCACWHFLASDLTSAQAGVYRRSDKNPGNSLLGGSHIPGSLASMPPSLLLPEPSGR